MKERSQSLRVVWEAELTWDGVYISSDRWIGVQSNGEALLYYEQGRSSSVPEPSCSREKAVGMHRSGGCYQGKSLSEIFGYPDDLKVQIIDDVV